MRVEEGKSTSLVLFLRSPAILDSPVWVKIFKARATRSVTWKLMLQHWSTNEVFWTAICRLSTARVVYADRLDVPAGWADCMTRLAQMILRVTASNGLMTDLTDATTDWFVSRIWWLNCWPARFYDWIRGLYDMTTDCLARYDDPVACKIWRLT